MYSSDQDFLTRADQHLHSSPHALSDKGDLILNPDVRKYYPSFRDAAVLISLIERPDGLTSLFNMRPQHLRSHAGQVGFPGGKVEEGDEGPIGTAVREAHEEIGLPGENVEPLGFLDAYITGSGFRVVPVLAKVQAPDRFILDPNEVESAFEVPISFLMNPENHGHGFITFRDKPRFYYEMPYFDGEQTWRIWGVTAGIVRQLYETVYPDYPAELPKSVVQDATA
ncbi:MAG: CoA pyrophosphatase [Pseudomonadota bacterium]